MEIAIEIDHPKKKEICTLLVTQFNNLIAKSKQSEQESESLTAKINRALKKFLGKVVNKDLRLYIYIYIWLLQQCSLVVSPCVCNMVQVSHSLIQYVDELPLPLLLAKTINEGLCYIFSINLKYHC